MLLLTAPPFLPFVFLIFKKKKREEEAVGGIKRHMGQTGQFFFFFGPRGFCQTMQHKPLRNERPAAFASTAARLPLLSYSFQAPHHAYENYSTEKKKEGVLCEGELFLSMSSPSR